MADFLLATRVLPRDLDPVGAELASHGVQTLFAAQDGDGVDPFPFRMRPIEGRDGSETDLLLATDEAVDRLFDSSGLLVFDQAQPWGWLQVRVEGQRETAWFRRGLPETSAVGQLALDRHPAGLRDRCFVRITNPPTARSSIATHWAKKVEKALPEDVPGGWGNPLLVRLTTGHPENENPGLGRLAQSWFDPANRLTCEPILPETWDVRRAFLEYFQPDAKTRSGAERLLFGLGRSDDKVPDWLPFLALDLLGGQFVIRRHGSEPVYSWRPPGPPCSGWEPVCWDYWCVTRWDGTLDEEPDEGDLFPPDPVRSSFVADLPDQVWDLDRDGDASGFLARRPGPPGGTIATMTEFLADRQIQTATHRPAVAIRRNGPGQPIASADGCELIEQFSRAFAEPASPILLRLDVPPGLDANELELVQGAFAGRAWVELLRTPAFARRRWLEQLVAGRGLTRARTREVPFGCGWWVHWLESFWTDAWDVRINLVSSAIPRLDEVVLDEGHLDVGPPGYRQPGYLRF